MVVWDLSISGGTQRQALELASYLVRKGHTVKIYCGYLNRAKCYPDLVEGLDVKALHEKDFAEGRNNVMRWILYPPEPLFSGESKRLTEIMDRDFDIVNPHDFQAYRTAFYYKHRHGTPVVWMVNDLPRSLMRMRLGTGPRRVLDAVHYFVMGGPLGYLVDRRRVRALDMSVVFDKPTMAEFKKRTGIEPVRMGSGLDPKAFEYRPRMSLPQKGPVSILDVGVFFPHRRYEDLLNAISLFMKDGYQASVTIVGSEVYDRAYAGKIHSLASALGIDDHVRFLGEVPEKELKELYRTSDVFVFPNYPQTWGLAPFEAMASGMPVIVSTGAGASEILTDGENALLVPPGRPDEIAGRLKRLCDDRSLYANLSRNGRRFVEDNVSWDAYGRRMEMLFTDAIGRSGSKEVKG